MIEMKSWAKNSTTIALFIVKERKPGEGNKYI